MINPSEIKKTKPVSDERLFIVEMAREARKDTLGVTSGILQQLLTLNTALLGGSVVFFSSTTINGHSVPLLDLESFHCLATCLVISLLASLLGILPVEGRFDYRDPDEAEAYLNASLDRKLGFLKLAAILLITGVGSAFVGMWLHHFSTENLALVAGVAILLVLIGIDVIWERSSTTLLGMVTSSAGAIRKTREQNERQRQQLKQEREQLEQQRQQLEQERKVLEQQRLAVEQTGQSSNVNDDSADTLNLDA